MERARDYGYDDGDGHHAYAAGEHEHDNGRPPPSSSQQLSAPYPMRRHGRPSSSASAASSFGDGVPSSTGGSGGDIGGNYSAGTMALRRDEGPLQYATGSRNGNDAVHPSDHQRPSSNGSHDDDELATAAHPHRPPHHHRPQNWSSNGGEQGSDGALHGHDDNDGGDYPPPHANAHHHGNGNVDLTKSPGRFTQAYRRHAHHQQHHANADGGADSDHPAGYLSGDGTASYHHQQPYYHQPHDGGGGGGGGHHPPQQAHHAQHHPHSHPLQYHPHSYHTGAPGGGGGGGQHPTQRRRHLILTKAFQCAVLLVLGAYILVVRRGAHYLDKGGGTKRDWWGEGFTGAVVGGGSMGGGGGADAEPPGQRGRGEGSMKGILGPAGTGSGSGGVGGRSPDGEDGGDLLYGYTDDDRPITTVSAERAARLRADAIGRARGAAERRARARRERTAPPSRQDRAREMEESLGTTARHSYAILEEDRAGMPPAIARPLHAEPEIPPVDRDATNADGSPLTEEQILEKEEARQKQLDAQIEALERLGSASAEELCGTEAREASRNVPGSYLKRDALNDQSRVLITGILNPIGFHLALALQNRCGVRTIMGIDHMFPNSILHRLEMVRRMSILSKEIPGLSQPVMLPYVGLDPRLNLKKIAAGGGGPHGIDIMLPSTGEINFLTFRPTHVVHLAGAGPNSYRDDAGVREGRHHAEHVYGTEDRTPPMYQVRTAGAGMEHILASIATAPDDTASGRNFRPHLVYASSRSVGDNAEKSSSSNAEGDQEVAPPPPSENFHPAIKMVDELLASTYSSLHGVYSVGLRLGDVYGPWGVQGSPDHDLAVAAVTDWERYSRPRVESTNGGDKMTDDETEQFSLVRAASLEPSAVTAKRDLLFVDDTVDALIAAMQFRKDDGTAAVFDLLSGADTDDNNKVNLETVASAMESFMPENDAVDNKNLLPALSSPKSKEGGDVSLSTNKHLGWSPATSIRDGIARLLAWHLDERSPYGPDPATAKNAKGDGSSPSNKELYMGDDDVAALAQSDGKSRYFETGNEFLQRKGFPTCSADDDQCHRGNHVMPCASECLPPSGTCKASIYDGVVDLTKDVTAGCDIVLYTMSLGYDVEELHLKATFHDDNDQDDGYDLSICNVAFVPSGSHLVNLAIENVPQNALEDVQSDEDKAAGKPVPKVSDLSKEEKLISLNGRILHRGWILVWVPDTMEGESADDMWLLKLTPGQLMHEDARYAMFVDEDFTVTPNIDDVQFLVSEMHRPALKERPLHKVDENGKKLKFVLPAEPERRAAILMNDIKQKKSKDEETGNAKKISVYDAVKFMVYENGGDPSQSDPKPLKRQREFYERVASFVNRDDLRSIAEPMHKYEMKHWIRSRWVVHDLKNEEGRQIRCDWFGEHAQWGNLLDQLSFAHVMAVRDIKRKLTRNEPDDRMRAQLPQEPEEIADIGDKQEWYPLIGPAESYEKDLDEISRIGRGENDIDEEAEAAAAGITASEEARPGQIYARVLSDKIMLICRKIWTENQNRRQRARQKKKEREEAQVIDA